MNLQTIIFFGSSGSGKGTQADLLLKYLEKNDPEHKVLHIETGELFRDFMKEKNYTSALTAEIVNQGRILPDFMPIWIWTEYLIKHFSGDEHLILDGVSRQPHEAKILDSAIRFYKRRNPIIVEIKVSRQWATKRLLERGRNDDSEEQIKRRLDWYYQKTSEALQVFKDNSYYSFYSINGEQDIEKVHEDLVSDLKLA